MNYRIELDLFIDEDKVRTKKEIQQIVKSIFDTYNCEATNIKVKIDTCEHDWRINGMKVIDPEGWYYNQPVYEIKYVCANCGKIKYAGE